MSENNIEIKKLWFIGNAILAVVIVLFLDTMFSVFFKFRWGATLVAFGSAIFILFKRVEYKIIGQGVPKEKVKLGRRFYILNIFILAVGLHIASVIVGLISFEFLKKVFQIEGVSSSFILMIEMFLAYIVAFYFIGQRHFVHIKRHLAQESTS